MVVNNWCVYEKYKIQGHAEGEPRLNTPPPPRLARHVTMDGHAAMAGRAARLFFFGFYFIVCLVVVTVVTAEVIISTSDGDPRFIVASLAHQAPF